MSTLFRSLLAVILLCSFAACSNSSDKDKDKGKIEKFTDRQADRMVKSIRDPMEKAKKAKEDIEKKYEADLKKIEDEINK